MKFLLDIHNKQRKLFEKGGKLERLYPLFEAHDTFVFTPGEVTHDASHVRDSVDLKRIMITVVLALLPCMLFGTWNIGYQASLAFEGGAAPLDNWRSLVLFESLGFDPLQMGFLAQFLFGALYYLPIYIVTLAAGGLIEVLFAIVRRHEINEGFLVTSALFPLTLPATTPLWQVALGIIFGVFIGKEIFGGTGMNIWNPALTARAFLYFAYPAQIIGDNVWVAAQTSADGYSGATWLAVAKEYGLPGVVNGVPEMTNAGELGLRSISWWEAFAGLQPGSIGETSELMVLIGAAVLLLTRVASWRIMVGSVAGTFLTALLFNVVTNDPDSYFAFPFYWHWVIGSYGFAAVFMMTDPVSAPFTHKGRYIYGFLIGALGITIREVNPAFAGSWMLAILFMNMFSPLIDHFLVQANVKRRRARYATA